MNVLVPLGTRPEFVKMAPVVSALRRASLPVTVVDTGQHTDPVMRDAIQDSLDLVPDVVHTLPDSARRGAMQENALSCLASLRPDVVLALGDTATVPTWALAARSLAIPFAHAEAGLRSFNPQSVEEVNRRVAAACASLHFAPTERAASFLLAEGISPERIQVVGNPGIDTLLSRGFSPRPLAERSGVLVTAHRPTNVDDPARLTRLVEVLESLGTEAFFPVHPRTLARLSDSGLLPRLESSGVRLSSPVGYDELLERLSSSRLVLTDSGGLQEEAAYFGVPALVLRSSTPRWEGVEAGSTVLASLSWDSSRILAALAALSTPEARERIASLPCPYGDGHASERIASFFSTPSPLLTLAEPDYTDSLPW